MNSPKYSIVAPVYNESESLPEFYRRISEVIGRLDGDVELILVDDGSSDGSLALMCDLQDRDSSVRVLSFSRNFGHQVAITAGIDFARGDAVIDTEADLETPSVSRSWINWRLSRDPQPR